MNPFRIVWASILVLCMFVISSCTKTSETESPLGDIREQVSVSVKDYDIIDLDNLTKTNLGFGNGSLSFTWALTDTIGIFPSTAKSQIPFPMADGVGTNSAVFDGGGWFVENMASYIAYYPFDGRMYHQNSRLNVSYSGIVQHGNNSTGHLGHWDYMGAKAVSPGNKNISFDFLHLGAVLIFKMYVPKATTYTGFSLECDESLFTTNGGIDLTGGSLFIAPTHLSRIYSIALEEITTTAANQLITLYVPIAPCNLSGKLITIRLTGPTVNYSTTFTPSKPFEAEHAYQKTTTFTAGGDVTKLVDGKTFNTQIKSFVNGEYYSLDKHDYNIKHIQFETNNLEVPSDLPYMDISDANSAVPIYAIWNASTRTLTIRSQESHIYAAGDCEQMFYNFAGLTSIDLNGLDMYYTRSMYKFFQNCESLESIDMRPLNTGNVIDLRALFEGCSKVSSIDLSNMNTSSMTDMEDMFAGCGKLESIDLSHFNTANLTGMHNVFNCCNALTSVNFGSEFNTSKVTNFSWLFSACENLESVDLSHFDFSKAEDLSYMFIFCRKLQHIIGDINVSSRCGSLFRMFEECFLLEELDVSEWNVSNVQSFGGCFSHCTSLTALDVSNWDVRSGVGFDGVFRDCPNVSVIDVSRWSTPNATAMFDLFQGCSSVSTLDVRGFITDNVTDMSSMFSGCSNLTSLDLQFFNTSNVGNMQYMFNGCAKLTSLDVSSFETSKVISMSHMFNECEKLASITFSSTNFDTHYCEDMSYMFNGDVLLTSLDLSFFNTLAVRDMGCMFQSCEALESLNISSFSTEHTSETLGFLCGCYNLADIDFGPDFLFDSTYFKMLGCGKDIVSGTINCSVAQSSMLQALSDESDWYRWEYKDKYVITTYPEP